jgi:putative endopeptidase
MDEPAIEKTGSATAKPLLDKTRGVKDARTFTTALVELHKLGIPSIFSIEVGPDFHDSLTNVTTLDAAGLGLPDRDYYVKPELAGKLEAYRAHVEKMFLLANPKAPPATAAADAASVVAIETELAKLTMTRVERRDVPAMYNVFDLEALAKSTKSLDWSAVFKGLNFTPSKKIVVGAPKFFAGLDAVRAKFKPAQWSAYFTYEALSATAFTLGAAFDDESFALAHALTGIEKHPERWKRCVDATTAQLGEQVGKAYADKYFPPAARDQAQTLVAAVVDALDGEITHLDWMTEPTRKTARAKLAKIARMIGYPDKPKTYAFAVKRDDFAGNNLRAAAFNTHRELAKSGKPVDRTEWQMYAFTADAYYEPTENTTALPAGILQPPYFGADRQIAANLGGIGMVIGHELTHGFDDQGALFDADGNLKNWWTADDKKKFDDKAACVADQYSSFEALPKQFVSGKLTLGEDIADLGGVKVAFSAYRNLRKDAAKIYIADGYTEDQQFFLAAGQVWCDRDRDAEIQRRLTVDVHAPPKFRVYGALRNLPEFAQAFGCAAGTPMRPTTTCSVW